MAEVTMPQLGESVTEGTLGKWLKQVGEPVELYEPLVEVITDKVNAEIPSEFEGVLSEVLVKEGETVKVGTPICRIVTDKDADSAPPALQIPSVENHTAPAAAVDAISINQGGPAAGRYSPAVLRLSQEHGIDLSGMQGTGEGGRITRKDVLAVAAERQRATTSTSSPIPANDNREKTLEASPSHAVQSLGAHHTAHPAPSVVSEAITQGSDEELINPSAVRKTIARRMVESWHTVPHAWTMVEVDVSPLVQLRDAEKSQFKRREGVELTYMPFFIKAVVEGLKQFPMMNSAWGEDGVHLKKRIHISVAVATDDGLAVPVIHDADHLSIAGLAHAVSELAAKARSGKLTVQDVQGGTFTVNNTGAFGSVLSHPILNLPQAGILSFESIVKRPVVVNDAIAIRSMLNLCLSVDHRVLDGWIAGGFLKAVKERLQSFHAGTALY